MSITAELRLQHKQILELVARIEEKLEPSILEQEAESVRETLALLTRQLTIHLAMEDKGLYPMLIARHNQAAKETTRKFMEEMGGISAVFKAYAAQWNTAKQLMENPAGFKESTCAVFTALRERIVREERELYPLAETL